MVLNYHNSKSFLKNFMSFKVIQALIMLSILFVFLYFTYILFLSIGVFNQRKVKPKIAVKNIDSTGLELKKYVSKNFVLSPFEKQMYGLLRKALPNYIILCQVSFNAFLKCGDIATRNKFNRNFCDFMVVNHEFKPLVCVELDDRTHHIKPKKDVFRDNLLAAAEIPTERFFGLPDSPKQIKNRLTKYLA